MNDFIKKCERNANKPFITEVLSGRVMTYGDLLKNVRYYAGLLIQKGIKKYDRVLLCFENQLEYVIASFSVLFVGATAIPVNPGSKGDYLEYILDQADPSVLLYGDGIEIKNFSTSKAERIVVRYGDAIEVAQDLTAEYIDNDFPLIILYTSGTTGNPKGVVLGYSAVYEDFMDYGRCYGFNDSTNFIVSLPLYHGDGWCHSVFCPYFFEASTVLTPVFNLKVAGLFDQLVLDGHDNILIAVPTMLEQLTMMKPRYSDIEGKLRMVLCGSSKLRPEVLENFEDEFKTRVYENYSLTESLMIAYFSPETESRPGSVGKIVDRCTVRILDDGEIVVRSPYIFKEYFHEPDLTESILKDGWLYTGDTGYVEDGYLFLTGRKKEIINKGGYKIDPNEVNTAIMKYPDIKDCITLGVADDAGSEKVISLVTVKSGTLDEKQLYLVLNKTLMREKLPDKVYVVSDIKRNALAKVEKCEIERLIKGI